MAAGCNSAKDSAVNSTGKYSQNQINSDIGTWKEYASKTQKFAFKYPPSWTVRESGDGSIDIDPPVPNGLHKITMIPTKDSRWKSSDDWYKDAQDANSVKEDIKIGGVNAYKVTSKLNPDDLTLAALHGDDLYIFNLGNTGDDIKLVNGLLETFRFLK